MNKEKLESRISELTNERQILMSNVNAYNGAIEECKRWLRDLDDGSTDNPE